MKKSINFWLVCLLFCGVQGCGSQEQAQDKTFTNSISMEFMLIPAGKFTTTVQEHKRVVTISKPFYLGKYEVTQEQWRVVMGAGSNQSQNMGRPNPVENVSWNDVQEFIKKLNEQEGSNKYRLPTEEEWEHAARAGTETEWFFGNEPDQLEQYAWCDKTFEPTKPVGQKLANPWGLYDIYGNVWEWVQDYWGELQAVKVTDPTGPTSGTSRVVRGGDKGSAKNCRSAARHSYVPGYSSNGHVGFRLALSLGQ